MKNVKKLLVYLVFCLIGLIIFNENVYATDVTCIYKDNSVTYTFTINTNDGNYNLEHKKYNESDRLTYYVNSKKISYQNFINNSKNTIVCPANLYYKKSGNSATISVELSFVDFNGAAVEPMPLSDSKNNNTSIDSSLTTINSCKYNGKNIMGGSIVSEVFIHLTSEGLKFEATNGYTVSKIDEANINTSTFTKNTVCSEYTVNVSCGNYNNNKYCTISKDDPIRPGTGTSGTDTPDSEDIESAEKGEYSCSYIGKISGKSLTITKTTEKWKIKLGDGGIKEVETSKVGGNIFPSSNCEDIFYLYNKKDSVKMVNSESKFLKETIAGYCRGYGNEVEQFCHNGNCKISNPLCGGSSSGGVDVGDCPQELRPVIYFVKKIAFNTLRIFIPIVLILMGSIDFIKAVMSNDDKAMKDSVSKFIKRALAAIFMFFIVTIVSAVINMVVDTGVGKNGWEACWYNID